MDVTPVNAGATSAAERSRTTLAADFNNFLTLLTTQLQYQDPLDPIDSNELVGQLVSFTGVEQAVNTNANLERMIDLLKFNQVAAAVNYLGTTVEARGDTTMLVNGRAIYVYNLPETVVATSVLITDTQGRVVFTGAGETSAGDHVFVWDGRDNDGAPLPEGLYKISLSARDAEGAIVPVTTRIGGRVNGVETVDGDIVLLVNGVAVPFGNVLSVIESDFLQPPPSP